MDAVTVRHDDELERDYGKWVLVRRSLGVHSFGINAVALVDGQPRTLGLLELLQVYLDHRVNVVRRRSERCVTSSDVVTCRTFWWR